MVGEKETERKQREDFTLVVALHFASLPIPSLQLSQNFPSFPFFSSPFLCLSHKFAVPIKSKRHSEAALFAIILLLPYARKYIFYFFVGVVPMTA